MNKTIVSPNFVIPLCYSIVTTVLTTLVTSITSDPQPMHAIESFDKDTTLKMVNSLRPLFIKQVNRLKTNLRSVEDTWGVKLECLNLDDEAFASYLINLFTDNLWMISGNYFPFLCMLSRGGVDNES